MPLADAPSECVFAIWKIQSKGKLSMPNHLPSYGTEHKGDLDLDLDLRTSRAGACARPPRAWTLKHL